MRSLEGKIARSTERVKNTLVKSSRRSIIVYSDRNIFIYSIYKKY